MREISVKGHAYQVQKLDALTQFHVARRIAPLAASLIFAGISLSPPDGADAEAGYELKILMAAAAPLSRMTDEDVNYVLEACLLRASRADVGGRFVPVWAKGGGCMFDDMDAPAMAILAWNVIQEARLTDFFTESP